MTSAGTAAEAGDPSAGAGGVVRVQYWAAARAAAGTAYDELAVSGETTLAAVTAAVLERRGDDRMRRVIGVCSVLVEDRPAGSGDPGAVTVRPGETVQYLPPFAGG